MSPYRTIGNAKEFRDLTRVEIGPVGQQDGRTLLDAECFDCLANLGLEARAEDEVVDVGRRDERDGEPHLHPEHGLERRAALVVVVLGERDAGDREHEQRAVSERPPAQADLAHRPLTRFALEHADLGVALFRKKREPQAIMPPAPLARREAADAASAAAPRDEARLGTGHGRRENSPVQQVAFERATPAAAETVILYYDSYRNLVAHGVIASSQPLIAPELQPFPGALSTFAPDPPG